MSDRRCAVCGRRKRWWRPLGLKRCARRTAYGLHTPETKRLTQEAIRKLREQGKL